MTHIKISDLKPAGSSLFSDSESYLKELSNEDLNLQGGFSPSPVSLPSIISVVISLIA